MALESGELAALGGVLVVLVAVLAYNLIRAKTSPLQARPAADGAEEPSVDARLSRFVVHEGNVVGETVAVEGDQLVLKQAGAYKLVPAAQTELAGDELQLRGDIDWKAAEAAGAAWHESNSKGVDDSVSGDLTTSADVKAPAREAFEKRQAEAEAGAMPRGDEEE